MRWGGTEAMAGGFDQSWMGHHGEGSLKRERPETRSEPRTIPEDASRDILEASL